MIAKLFKYVVRFLARLDVAAVLLLALLLIAAIGSFFPQRPAAPEQAVRWEEAARERYGASARLLDASGAFHWTRSPLFLALAALAALATLVCTLDRWGRVWRRAFRRPVRCSDATFDSAPYTASLEPAPGEPTRAVSEALRQRGFRVRTAAEGDVTHLRGDRNRFTPLATLVTHTAVLLLLAGALLTAGGGWREEVTAGPGEAVEVAHGSGLVVRNEGFAVERYADGSAAGYEARIAVTEGGGTIHGRVRVNEPLAVGGVSLVLQGYERVGESYRVTLLAVRDPGYGPVVAGGLLLLLGLTASFNLPHARVHARVEPGRLRLAGRADRRAWGFGKEFEEIVEEVG